MLSIAPPPTIYLHSGATDMRKSFDGLSGIIRGNFGGDPADGSLFLFVNKRRDRIKALWCALMTGPAWLTTRLVPSWERRQRQHQHHQILSPEVVPLSGDQVTALNRAHRHYQGVGGGTMGVRPLKLIGTPN